LAALSLVLALPSIARAHRVNVFAYVEDGTIHTESYFSGGAPCRECKIEVSDGSGKLLLTGKTDEQGEFSFTPPIRGDMKIVLWAGMGHRAEYTLKAEELPDSTATKKPTTQQPKKPRPQRPKPQLPTLAQAIAGIGYIVGIVGIAMYIRARQLRKKQNQR